MHDITVLNALARTLDVLARSPAATADHIAVMIAQFGQLLEHFAMICNKVDLMWYELNELEDGADYFGCVFDALFAQRPEEMLAFSGGLQDSQFPEYFTPFLAAVWADAVAWPNAPGDRPLLISQIHEALRVGESRAAHRRLAQYYAALPEVDPAIANDFLDLMFKENEEPRLLSALIALAGPVGNGQDFEEHVQRLLSRLKESVLLLQDDCDEWRRELEKIRVRCRPELAADIETIIKTLIDE
jgi:hypothetical protein